MHVLVWKYGYLCNSKGERSDLCTNWTWNCTNWNKSMFIFEYLHFSTFLFALFWTFYITSIEINIEHNHVKVQIYFILSSFWTLMRYKRSCNIINMVLLNTCIFFINGEISSLGFNGAILLPNECYSHILCSQLKILDFVFLYWFGNKLIIN